MPDASQLVSLVAGSTDVRQGFEQLLDIADPAAGSGYVRVVPGQYWERYLAVAFVFTASATAANRYPHVSLRGPGGNAFALAKTNTAITASTTTYFRLATSMGWQPASVSPHVFGGMPDVVMHSGWELHIDSDAIQSGDTFTDIRLLTQRYPTNATQDLAGYGPP